MEVDGQKSKAELDILLAKAEADGKYASQNLKTYPKCPRYLGMQEASKELAEKTRKQLCELQDPVDQLRQKGVRLARLAGDERKLREKLREACQKVEDAEKEVSELRGKIYKVLEESDKIKSEQKVLVLAGGVETQAAAPVDLGVAVEGMRDDFTKIFDDAGLPQQAAAKKEEVEKAFTTMAQLVGMLSSLSAEYKAAKQQGVKSPGAAEGITEPPKEAAPPPAAVVGAAASSSPVAAADPVVQSTGTPSDKDRRQDSASVRERTRSPKGKLHAKVCNRSDDELLGPKGADGDNVT